MNYESELNFVKELLKPYHLKVCLFEDEELLNKVISEHMWMKEICCEKQKFKHTPLTFIRHCQPNTVYKIDDIFQCKHIIFLLPTENKKNILAYIGPYTKDIISKEYINELAEKHCISKRKISQVESYNHQVPVLEDETFFMSVIYTFCTQIFGGSDKFVIKQLERFHPIDFGIIDEIHCKEKDSYFVRDMIFLQEYNDLECQLMQIVSSGNISKAELLCFKMFDIYLANCRRDKTESIKRYLLVLNTILKVVVQGKEVPIDYIDRLFYSYIDKIENIVLKKEAKDLIREMIYKYCLSLKKYVLNDYSLLVSKSIAYIESNLAADLGLKNLAVQLNVNASYLSGLFKKETGYTLTEYVNLKRIEYAVFLLESSDMQVRVIAQSLGINVNYFTKIFKRIKGVTPKEYRNQKLDL